MKGFLMIENTSYVNQYSKYQDLDLNQLLQVLTSNIQECFTFAEYLYMANGLYRSATERVAKYFITDLSYGEEGIVEYEDKDFKVILEEDLSIKTIAGLIMVDLLVYGNSLSFVYTPFTRQLICPQCNTIFNIETTAIDDKNLKFDANAEMFTTHCIRCDYKGKFDYLDLAIKNASKISIRRIDPKTINIDHDSISGDTIYYLMPDEIYSAKVRENNRHILAKAPIIILSAIGKDKCVKFENSLLCHLKIPGISGLYRGWGIPPVIGIAENIVKQHYYTTSELVFLKDYMTIQRILYPSAMQNPMMGGMQINMDKFKSEMGAAIEAHRKDRTRYLVSPFPVGYQVTGGEGKSLQLTNEIEFNTKQLLAALGYPAELYYMTFNMQALPASLRLFENYWSYIPEGLNKWIKFVIKQICGFLKLKEPSIKWQTVRMADDIERRQVLLQLAQSQQVALSTALESYGIDFKKELGKIIKQTETQQEVIEEAAENQKIKSEITGEPQPGQQAGAGGQSDLNDTMMQQATQVAQQWMQMDETQRRSQMTQLNQSNKILHDVAMSIYNEMKENIRQNAGNQAIAQQRQQMQQMQPQQPPTQ
ncbi:MAG: hypothetical protein ABIH48_02920 [Candidatus Falkowbacteria bacterium]